MSGMNLTVIGQGLTADRVDAMHAGLAVMGVADASVIVADDFVSTVNDLTSQQSYSTGRGAGVVAARTIPGDDGSTIVVNGPETRNRSPQLIERLLAHEAGHIWLNERKERLEGRRRLVGADWEWWLLCIGGLALDELRIERSLADLGYPTANAGTMAYAENALYCLNVEVVDALLDPASADIMTFSQSIMKTHDWLAKQLAYLAAFRSDATEPGLAGLSTHAKENWEDYIGSTWDSRVVLYESVPTALDPISDADLNELLVGSKRQEEAQLAKLGFRYASFGDGFSFHRTASDTLCNVRAQRALEETGIREKAQQRSG
ncbi:hypothetical protein [Actinomadura chokoriensis]|uniref:hypothetical protein n=1 Tax=Actinomadura chokoriensis TaxID=454156 RepID=UPI0031F93387